MNFSIKIKKLALYELYPLHFIIFFYSNPKLINLNHKKMLFKYLNCQLIIWKLNHL